MRRLPDLRIVPPPTASGEPPFHVRVIRFSGGERFPLLFRRESPSPEIAPLLFLLSELRPRHLATKTLLNCLRAIQFLFTWALAESISLRDRINAGHFLTLSELDRLRYAARLPLEDLYGKAGPPPLRPGGLAERIYAPLPLPSADSHQHSEYQRLYYAHLFLAWWSDSRSDVLARDPGRRREYDAEKVRFIDLLKKRIPDPPQHSGRRKGPPSDVIERLIKIICPGHPLNPWRSWAVQFRNYLFLRILMQTGLRLGEVLSMRMRCIAPSAGEIHIVRLPDAPDDRRLIPPTVKGHAHIVPLWDLYEPLSEYVLNIRRRTRNANQSPFVLVASRSGRELSESAARKVLQDLAAALEYDGPLSPHVLRHGWNDSLSATMDALGIPAAQQEAIRIFLMGWSDGSTAAATYTRRFVEEEARRVLQAHHARYFPNREGP